MAQIPNLKFDKNKAYLTEQLEIQKSNRNNVSDIIANIKFINSSYNCNQYYLEDLLKTGDELIAFFDNNIATIDKLTEDLSRITTSLSEILSPENQKTKTKSYFLKSFTELEKDVTEYSKNFNDLVQKIDNDNTTYSTFIASCNLNSAVDAAISDNPDDILKIMQANLVEKDNIFSDIANSGTDEDIDDSENDEDESDSEDTDDTDDTDDEDENNDENDDIQEESSLYEETVDYASEEDASTKSKSKTKTKSKSKSKSNSDSDTKAKAKTKSKAKSKSKTSENAESLDEDEKNTKGRKGTKKTTKKNKKDSNVFEELTDTDEENAAEEISSTEGENDSDNTDDSKETSVPIEMNNMDENITSEDIDDEEEINSSAPVSITDELRDILDNMDDMDTSENETKDAISQGVQGLIDASFNFTVRELKNSNEDFYNNINSMISEYDDFSVPISKIGSARAAESQKNTSEENEEKTDEQTSPLKPIHINNNNFYNYDNSSYSFNDIEKARKEKNASKPLDIAEYTAEDMANKTIFLSTDEINARLSKDNTAPTEKLEDLNLEDLVKGTASINNSIFTNSSVTSDTIVLNDSESVLENINNIVPEETVKVDTIKLNNEKTNTFESIIDDSTTIIDDNDVSMFNDYEEGLASLDEVESLADALNNSDNVSITMEDKETNVETVVKAGDNNQEQQLSREKIEKIIRAEADNETLVISEKNNKIYLPYKMSEINNYINSYPGTYSSPSDVVRQEFILDLSDFMKHPSRTRFQETYTLIRNRDGKSVASAILYGLKLTKKSNLSPAVIAACKHQDELEVYLNCLNENKLSDFKAFNIIYEINPLKGQKNI